VSTRFAFTDAVFPLDRTGNQDGDADEPDSGRQRKEVSHVYIGLGTLLLIIILLIIFL
jgi:hypothetical protein